MLRQNGEFGNGLVKKRMRDERGKWLHYNFAIMRLIASVWPQTANTARQ
jgi:hypothetical protein